MTFNESIAKQQRALGDKIRRCRLNKKMPNGRSWALHYLRDRLFEVGWEITPTSLSRIERGIQDIASSNIFRLAQVLGVPADELFRSRPGACGPAEPPKYYRGDTLDGVAFMYEVDGPSSPAPPGFVPLHIHQGLYRKYNELQVKYRRAMGMLTQVVLLLAAPAVQAYVGDITKLLA